MAYFSASHRRLLTLVRAAPLIAAAFHCAPAAQAFADGAQVPLLAGDWNVSINDNSRKLHVTQDAKSNHIEGVATWMNGDTPTTSFQISGSVDEKGTIKLKLYWDKSELTRDNKVTEEGWAAAVTERSKDDASHPDLLPAGSEFELAYKEDPTTVTETITGNVLVPGIKEKLDKGKFVKLDAVNDKSLPVEITRGYAARCAGEMGKIPPFTCGDGARLLITVNDDDQDNPVAKCDRPVQLGLRDVGQCVPHSRLRIIPIPGHPKIVTVAICRKYGKSTANDPLFDDIAMIAYNPETGHTCFYQSPIGRGTHDGLYDGNDVPSPTDDNPKQKVWGERTVTNEDPDPKVPRVGGFGPAGQRCNHCHSAGPFLWSPYVAQGADDVEEKWHGKPSEPWDSNFANMFGMSAFVFFPKYKNAAGTKEYDNACSQCHRIGDGNNCAVFVPRYAAASHANSDNKKHWMPPPDNDDNQEWHDEYDTSVAQIATCCANPNLPECHRKEAKIPPKPQ